ncbi:hypothetical protein GCM10029976_091090 [Kribbella albertanoniae]|uniref:hypothetical protein n=1 Tax=Kribbella albertanoniae TaxID=1266829 RepID=UPI0014050038|nr:hypothetical protein [Kribbella albertanoniae]
MSARVPDVPAGLIRDTNNLLATLDQTVANLRDFTEKLRAATDQQRLQGGNQ